MKYLRQENSYDVSTDEFNNYLVLNKSTKLTKSYKDYGTVLTLDMLTRRYPKLKELASDLEIAQYGRYLKYNNLAWQMAGGVLSDTLIAKLNEKFSWFPKIVYIKLPNGDMLDAPHFWATMNIQMRGYMDGGGWAGDMIEFANDLSKDSTIKFPYGGFSLEDWLADTDAYNMYNLDKTDLFNAMKLYYTEDFSEKRRVQLFKTDKTMYERYTSSADKTYLNLIIQQGGYTGATEETLKATGQQIDEYMDKVLAS